jgi:hypothetical protein
MLMRTNINRVATLSILSVVWPAAPRALSHEWCLHLLLFNHLNA